MIGQPPQLFRDLPADADPAYRHLFERTNERAAEAREICDHMWRDAWDLLDRDFVAQFPTHFQERWFELYLAAALRRAGLNPVAPKPGPDLRIDVGGVRVWIEAIVPGPGHPLHPDAVPTPTYVSADGQHEFMDVPTDQVTLRLAQAFRQKAEKFGRYRQQGVVGPGDACVIAMNVRAIPHAWLDAREYYLRSLYGIGNLYVEIDRASGRAVSSGRHTRDLLQRAGGADEDVAPLVREEHAAISAVLGSVADCANLPARAGDDFEFLPHALPTVPVPRGAIPRGFEWVLDAHADGSGWKTTQIDHRPGAE